MGQMSNKTYDILKWVTLIALPAFGTLYATLSGVWGFPYGDQVTATTLALSTFLGVLLQISSSQYNNTINNE